MSQLVASNGGGGGGGGSVASASSSSAAVAQQEAALRKLEAERDRLVAEVLTLQEAMSTSKACEECVDARAAARERAGAPTRPQPTASFELARLRSPARPHARTHAH